MVMLIDIEEYQQVVDKSYKNRRGRLKTNQIPTMLNEVIYLNNKDDYQKILPELPDNFSASEFAKELKVSSRKISYIIQVLKYLNVIEVIKKDGKKHIYHLVK